MLIRPFGPPSPARGKGSVPRDGVGCAGSSPPAFAATSYDFVGQQQLCSDCALVRHRHDELIGTSALASAVASLACSAGSSSLSPRRCRHSTSPCSAHTLSGCFVQRGG